MKENDKVVMYIGSESKIQPIRPDPIISDYKVVLYKQRMQPHYAVEALVEGFNVLIADFYSSGLAVLNELKKIINEKFPDSSFDSQRHARNTYRELSNRLLLKIRNHKLIIRKAPEIGWLKILYPELDDFLLPFPQIQGLNSSWQWYVNGIFVPVLRQKIFPWYGTYFPTRFEHIELFESWLKEYKGKKETAIDIGIGSGILTFQMLKHGFGSICGTDSNPNAIIGLQQHIEKHQLQSKINLKFGDMFANCDSVSELVAFNPPWLPALYNPDGLDSAIYYDADLFPRFFSEAAKHLIKGGRLAVIFSNLAQITNHETEHPIEKELLSGGRFIKERFMDKQVRPGSKKTRRKLDRHSAERVELWILKPIGEV
ncbi:MAG: methyltransferase [Lentimicrobium sp.]|nr:methyltransferase [Lentimicrobium sp.]